MYVKYLFLFLFVVALERLVYSLKIVKYFNLIGCRSMAVDLLEYDVYKAKNSDLAKVGITTNQQLRDHFLNFGINEGRVYSSAPLVSLELYDKCNPDLKVAGLTTKRQLFEHLEKYGIGEGRSFSSIVNLDFYSKANADLLVLFKGTNIDIKEHLFGHLRSYGLQEGRHYSSVFDPKFYLDYNSDLNKKYTTQSKYVDAFSHLVNYGANEKRVFSQFFNIQSYLQNNKDLVDAQLTGTQTIEHFQKYGLSESRKFSDTLDLQFYKNNYGDLIAAKFDNKQLYEHFQLYGINEKRASSEFFNLKFYQEYYNDLASFNPSTVYEHYQLIGKQEGRFSVPIIQQKLSKQLGTSVYENAKDIVVDVDGNIYFIGYTFGNLGGDNLGLSDAWLTKFDKDENRIFTKQFGSKAIDISSDLAIDSSGNIYITGSTYGSLSGSNIGSNDAWLAKYDKDGNQIFLKQFGSTGDDITGGITVGNDGYIYIAGSTNGNIGQTKVSQNDAWFAKYDSSGNQILIKQFGSNGDDFANDIAVDTAGNIYLTGETNGAFEGSKSNTDDDAWLVKFDKDGNKKFAKQLGSAANDIASSIFIDTRNYVYITGSTKGSLSGTNTGDDDAWFAKYNSNGEQVFINQIGTKEQDKSIGITVDISGNIFIAGDTKGALGIRNAGGSDIWVGKFDSNGKRIFITETGTTADDSAENITIDSKGNIFLIGSTKGEFAGSLLGATDVLLAKFFQIQLTT
jgi:sugar lactone lactonase YvrE